MKKVTYICRRWWGGTWMDDSSGSYSKLWFCDEAVNELLEIPPSVRKVELVASTKPINKQSIKVTVFNRIGYRRFDGKRIETDVDSFPNIEYDLFGNGPTNPYYLTVYYEEEE